MSNKKINLIKSIEELRLDQELEDAWLELGDQPISFENKFLRPAWMDANKIPELIVQTCMDPEYLHFFCKYILNIDLLPFQGVMLKMLWEKKFPMIICSRGASKSFTLAVYAIMRAVLHQGCKIVVVGAALRQSMILFNYVEQIWNNAPILRSICGGKNFGPKKELHRAVWKCGSSDIVFLPLGNGEKIRGQRANVIIADEFGSINEEIFETVVRGFAAVKSGGVYTSVVQSAKEKLMAQRGIVLNKEEMASLKLPNVLDGNQIILSGTASFQFNHFYKYFQDYKAIIETGGDLNQLKNLYPDKSFDGNLNAEDYAIFRLPYDRVPEGMMDPAVLSQGRTTMDPMIFDMEYGAIFPSDSAGFFLASDIHNATCPIAALDGTQLDFTVLRFGDRQKRYIMGIDPASEDDKFTICIIEDNTTHRRYVYQWATNRKDFEKLQREKIIDDEIKDYHTFCILHVRDLLRRFNVAMMVVDAGGGGVYVREGLKDPHKMLSGDEPILDMDDENAIMQKGRHILKMIEFSSSDFRRESHYGLRKDILDKILLFPSHDEADVALKAFNEGSGYDTTSDIYDEILQCRTEITMIKHSITPNGTEQWDVPKIHGLDEEQNKKYLKKDRFTSLLLANWGCRLLLDNTGYSVNSSVYSAVRRGSVGTGMAKSNLIVPRVISSSNGRKIYY
jgi:hypothetical protein